MFEQFERLNNTTKIFTSKPDFKIEVDEITSETKKIISFNRNRNRSNTLISNINNSALAKLRLESLNEEQFDIEIPKINPLNNICQKLNFEKIKIK